MPRQPSLPSHRSARRLLLLPIASRLLALCGLLWPLWPLAAPSLLAAGCGRGGVALAEPHPAMAQAPPGGAGKAEPPAAAAGKPRRGGTAVTGWSAEPAGINEYVVVPTAVTQELLIQVFLRLLEENPDFEKHPATFSPLLARSYVWSPDHRLLTFKLRDDVRWSDGVPVTADDVRFTWQAQTSPEVAWQFSHMKAEIADVEVVDPHTVRFHFKRAYAKQLMDANEGGILPRHVWGQVPFSRWRQSGDWFKQHLVADGPFVVESWKPQQQIVLRRNDSYFDPGHPYLDRVVMRVIPDQASLLAQLDSGDLDYAAVVNPADAPRILANPRLVLLRYWVRTWVGVAWNTTREPFTDPEVRRALSLALDRPTIVTSIWHGYARVSDSPVLAAVWAHDRALRPLPYDPAEARRILAAKGWKPGPDGTLQRGGKPFAFELSTNTGNQQRVDALEMIQEQLRRIGVRATPRQVEFNTLSAQIDAGSYDASVVGNTVDTGLDLSPWFHSRAIGETNQTRYSNPEVDRLLDHAMSLPDIAMERQDLDRIQEIVQRDQPYSFLWESQRLSVHNRRLKGVQPNLLYSFYKLRDWWAEPPTER
jgi:peptide/nickel transport system substrate-binding protein